MSCDWLRMCWTAKAKNGTAQSQLNAVAIPQHGRRDDAPLIKKGAVETVLIDKQRRIITPTVLRDGDRIQLGLGGPIFCFRGPAHPKPIAGHSLGLNEGVGREAAAVAVPVIP